MMRVGTCALSRSAPSQAFDSAGDPAPPATSTTRDHEGRRTEPPRLLGRGGEAHTHRWDEGHGDPLSREYGVWAARATRGPARLAPTGSVPSRGDTASGDHAPSPDKR